MASAFLFSRGTSGVASVVGDASGVASLVDDAEGVLVDLVSVAVGDEVLPSSALPSTARAKMTAMVMNHHRL